MTLFQTAYRKWFASLGLRHTWRNLLYNDGKVVQLGTDTDQKHVQPASARNMFVDLLPILIDDVHNRHMQRVAFEELEDDNVDFGASLVLVWYMKREHWRS